MRRNVRSRLLAIVLAALLGVASAVLVACGSSGAGLIPAAQGGPLQSDIEAIEQAAEAGDGNCSATEAALLKADRDFAQLPSSVDSGLRDKIRLGLENLHKVAREACAQPLARTNTATTPKTTSTETTQTETTPPTTTSTTTTTPPPSETESEEETPGAGGGTPAPGEGNGKPPGVGSGGAGAEEGNGDGGSEGIGK